MNSSGLAGKYEKAVDRPSAYERVQARTGQKAEATGAPAAMPGASVPEAAKPSFFSWISKMFQPRIGPRGGRYDSVATTAMKSAERIARSPVGQQMIRGVFGNLIRKPTPFRGKVPKDSKPQ